MKQATVIAILAVLVLSSGNAEAQLIGSIGLPRGYMDFSMDITWLTSFSRIPLVNELMFNESFSTKADGADGRLGMNVLSVYVLRRYRILPSGRLISPYIAAGIGIHNMLSFTDSNHPFGSNIELDAVSKVHLFLGLDFSLSTRWFLSAQGRITYPSDIIVDSGYLGLGMKLRK